MGKKQAILITTFLGMFLLGAAACGNDNAVKSSDDFLPQEEIIINDVSFTAGDTLKNVPGMILKFPFVYDPGPDDYYYLIAIMKRFQRTVAFWPGSVQERDPLPEAFKEDSLRVVFSGVILPIPLGYRLIAPP